MTALTEVQRLETRRTLLQSIAEMSRGLNVISGMLKMGMMGTARDQIAAIEAMLQLHEMLARELNKENRRLAKENTYLAEQNRLLTEESYS